MDNHGTILNLYLRFYSGPGANILVTDDNDILLDLLYRRPGREEQSGQPFALPEPREVEGKEFLVRERTGESFNEQIEEAYGAQSNTLTREELIGRVERKMERELKSLKTTLGSLMRTSTTTQDFLHFKKFGDLLSANQHLLKGTMDEITLEDWETGEPITIPLDDKILARENVHLYYEKYQKAKKTHENAMGGG